MKRVLFALMIVVAVFSIAGVGGSLAYFSDEEAATDNTFEVGVWDLDNDSWTIVIQDVNKNDSGTEPWTVTYTGTVESYLDLDISVTHVDDLVNHVTAQLSVDVDVIYSWGAIIGLAGHQDVNYLLGDGDWVDITLDWAVDGSYTHVDTDKVTVVIDFELKATP